MKTFIGMVAFVLEQENNPNEYNPSNKYKDCLNYANFLLRQPQLSDFVACGEDGLPLYKKQFYYTEKGLKQLSGIELDIALSINKEADEYQQALDKVLFKGFEIFTDNGDFTRIELKDKLFITFYKEAETIVLNAPYADTKDITTIESLTPYNLELTDNANKIIGV